MMAPRQRLLAGVLGLVVLAGCGRESASPTDAGATAPETEYMAVGTLNSVNSAAGTVNVSHVEVPAAGWPAMTMDFRLAEPSVAADLKPGDRVDLHFTIQDGMNATVTHIERID